MIKEGTPVVIKPYRFNNLSNGIETVDIEFIIKNKIEQTSSGYYCELKDFMENFKLVDSKLIKLFYL